MTVAIDIVDGRGLSNKAHRERLPQECYISCSSHTYYEMLQHSWQSKEQDEALQCIKVSGHTVCVAKHLKTRLGSSFTVRILV